LQASTGTIVSPAHFALRLWKANEREVQVKAQGASMAPLIRAGDLLSLRLREPGTIKTGDLLAFWLGKNLVVHRCIIKKKQNGRWWFCQKGDNASVCSWVPEDDVLGQVTTIRSTEFSLNMTGWPWTWTNFLVGLATASLMRIAAGERVRYFPVSGRCLPEILVSSGNKILNLLIKAVRLVTCQRGGQALVNQIQKSEKDGL
jgi:signal peptidase I